MAPIKSIRKRCLDCQAGSTKEVIACVDTDCFLWEYRLGRKPVLKRLSSLKSIRSYCVDFCMNGSMHEVNLCTSPECSLYNFRQGHNPSRQGIGGNIVKIYNKRVAELDKQQQIYDFSIKTQ